MDKVKPGNGNAGPVVQIAWVDLDTRTGALTLRASTGIRETLSFAKALADLAVQYAAERAVEAARIEAGVVQKKEQRHGAG